MEPPVDAAPTGKRVLVVGARPSGLFAACHLTLLTAEAGRVCRAIRDEPASTSTF